MVGKMLFYKMQLKSHTKQNVKSFRGKEEKKKCCLNMFLIANRSVIFNFELCYFPLKCEIY